MEINIEIKNGPDGEIHYVANGDYVIGRITPMAQPDKYYYTTEKTDGKGNLKYAHANIRKSLKAQFANYGIKVNFNTDAEE